MYLAACLNLLVWRFLYIEEFNFTLYRLSEVMVCNHYSKVIQIKLRPSWHVLYKLRRSMDLQMTVLNVGGEGKCRLISRIRLMARSTRKNHKKYLFFFIICLIFFREARNKFLSNLTYVCMCVFYMLFSNS